MADNNNREARIVTVIGCEHTYALPNGLLDWCDRLFCYASYGVEEHRPYRRLFTVRAEYVSGVRYSGNVFVPYFSIRDRVREMYCLLCERRVGYELDGVCHFMIFCKKWIQNRSVENLIGVGEADPVVADDGYFDDGDNASDEDIIEVVDDDENDGNVVVIGDDDSSGSWGSIASGHI